MAFPVIPEKYLGEFPKETVKEKAKEAMATVANKTSVGFGNFFDFLIVLTVAFWYYFFTGLAIVCKRDIPKPWLRLGTHLGMYRVTSRLKKSLSRASGEVLALKDQPKKTFKVVDIDTKRPMKVLKSSK